MAQNSDVQYVAYLKAKFNLEDDELLQVFSMSQQQQQQPPEPSSDAAAKQGNEYEEVEEEMDQSYEEVVEEEEEEEVEDEDGEYEVEVMDESYEEQFMDESAEKEKPTTPGIDPEAGEGALVETNDGEIQEAEDDEEPVKVTESFVGDSPAMPDDVPEDEARADTGAIVPATSTGIVPVPEQAPPIDDQKTQPRDGTEKEERRSSCLMLLCCCLILLLIAIAVILILIFATETIPKWWEEDDDGPVTMGPVTMGPVTMGPVTMGPYEPGCDFSGQAQPNVIAQCECGDTVEILADYTRDRYEELVDFIAPGVFAVWTFDINSCDPANLALLWLSTGPAIDDPVRLRQRYVLAYLYYGTQGQQWETDTNWLSETDECDWYGIECEGTELSMIVLPGNSLDGQV